MLTLGLSALFAQWGWAVFTICASAAQTARNAMQRDLIRTLGTAGATHVRFLFALPFAAISIDRAAQLAHKCPVVRSAHLV